MTGRRGRPKTSGNSHNKASKTYSSSRVDRDPQSLPQKIQAKNTLETFFKPINKQKPPETPQQSLIAQLTSQLPPEPSISTPQGISEQLPSPPTSPPPMSVESPESSDDESICSQAISPPSSPPSSDSELSSDDDQRPKKLFRNNNNNNKRSLNNSKFDGRSNKLQFTVKWEKAFPWAYYSASKEGWFCKTCEEFSDCGDEFWKTLPRKHDEHPGVFFHDHENCNKLKVIVLQNIQYYN